MKIDERRVRICAYPIPRFLGLWTNSFRVATSHQAGRPIRAVPWISIEIFCPDFLTPHQSKKEAIWFTTLSFGEISSSPSYSTRRHCRFDNLRRKEKQEIFVGFTDGLVGYERLAHNLYMPKTRNSMQPKVCVMYIFVFPDYLRRQ